jgi:hypothetical protein
MLFTLSLPVSRKRLFLVRAGLGAVETFVLVVINVGLTLYFRPEATPGIQSLQYGVRAIVCTMAIYSLSALLACVLDETWQFTGSCLILGALWALQSRFAAVAQLSPLRGMSLLSCPLGAPMPWASLLTAFAATGIFLSASISILQKKQF